MEDKRNIADEMKGMDEDRIRMLYNERALPFAVCVVNLTGGLNMGCIVRAANAFGAEKIFYVGKKHWNRVSSVGITNYTSVNFIPTFEELLELKDEYKFVGVDNNVEGCKPIGSFKYAPNTLFLFGEEGIGLEKQYLDVCDDIVFIPQIGTVRSLNVSTAAGIVMFDYISKADKMI
jgi:tRNA G18 (ribose-2'-O)-methylase SpoU